jgi:DNA-binding transcriptional regulator YdaS (Cro superfamily)
MDLNTYLNTIETLIAFSKRTGIPGSSLSNWRHGKRPIPIEWMPILEKETGGLVSRKDLCPDNWQELWPELANLEQKKTEEAA